jgi:hypothetical protein
VSLTSIFRMLVVGMLGSMRVDGAVGMAMFVLVEYVLVGMGVNDSARMLVLVDMFARSLRHAICIQ